MLFFKMGRRVILYEGKNLEEFEKAKKILEENEIRWALGFGTNTKLGDMPFPVLSEGMVDHYGSEAIESRYSR